MIDNLGYTVDYIIEGKWKNRQGIIALIPPANSVEELDADFFYDKIVETVNDGICRENTPAICFVVNWRGSLKDLEDYATRKSTNYMGDMNIVKIINEPLMTQYIKEEGYQ